MAKKSDDSLWLTIASICGGLFVVCYFFSKTLSGLFLIAAFILAYKGTH